MNGISATGKSWVARGLGERLGLPVFSKDGVKEPLFDVLGVKDRAWSHTLSGASHAVLNPILEELLRAGVGFVMEANFNPEFDGEKYRRWQAEYGFSGVQVLCWAEGAVVYERFVRRVDSGERHPGHGDGESLEAYREYLMQGRCLPLDVGFPVVEVETTDFGSVDLDWVAAEVRRVSGLGLTTDRS